MPIFFKYYLEKAKFLKKTLTLKGLNVAATRAVFWGRGEGITRAMVGSEAKPQKKIEIIYLKSFLIIIYTITIIFINLINFKPDPWNEGAGGVTVSLHTKPKQEVLTIDYYRLEINGLARL